MIENGLYQDAINELYYSYVPYPVNKDTIIPLYGNEYLYNDFGVTPSLDIIYAIYNLKKIYKDWNWNDLIGLGKGYGAYLLEMTERLSPGTFSLTINISSILYPKVEDLFYNLTEWENGKYKGAYIKNIGNFPLYLVDYQGWTTHKNHKNCFQPYHFDIRDLTNDNILNTIYSVKNTPRIFIDFYFENKLHLQDKMEYINKLIEYNYSLEYFCRRRGY